MYIQKMLYKKKLNDTISHKSRDHYGQNVENFHNSLTSHLLLLSKQKHHTVFHFLVVQQLIKLHHS